MARWASGERTVQYLVDQNRLESFEAEDLAALAEALVARAVPGIRTRRRGLCAHWPRPGVVSLS